MQAVCKVAGFQRSVKVQEIDLLSQGGMFGDKTRHKRVKGGPDSSIGGGVIHPQKQVSDYQLCVRPICSNTSDEMIEAIGGVCGVLARAVIVCADEEQDDVRVGDGIDPARKLGVQLIDAVTTVAFMIGVWQLGCAVVGRVSNEVNLVAGVGQQLVKRGAVTAWDRRSIGDRIT